MAYDKRLVVLLTCSGQRGKPPAFRHNRGSETSYTVPWGPPCLPET